MTVIIYTIPSCKWSTKAKAYLTKKKIAFEDKDITEDKPARKEIIDVSGQVATPVLKIGAEIIIGFNQKKIDAALSKL
ncbi:NrdH-redoxin [archaeon]|nr:NrdH-redoxin [archaeon]|tara:strand:+ start:4224 stop:4457 length:234 start_codon:yes stop_codon:yes gene_type:complete